MNMLHFDNDDQKQIHAEMNNNTDNLKFIEL